MNKRKDGRNISNAGYPLSNKTVTMTGVQGKKFEGETYASQQAQWWQL